MEVYATRKGIADTERELNALEAKIRRVARQRSDLSLQLSELTRDRERLQRHHAIMVRELEGRGEHGRLLRERSLGSQTNEKEK